MFIISLSSHFPLNCRKIVTLDASLKNCHCFPGKAVATLVKGTVQFIVGAYADRQSHSKKT